MDNPVVVVGAGPIGLVIGCELLGQGVAVRIVDAVREHSAHSRATSIWPRPLELLRRIGVADRLVEEGHRVQGVAYFSDHKPLATAWLDRLGDTPYPFAIGLSQHRTEALLLQRLVELGGKVERGVRLEWLDASGPRARLRFALADGGTEEVEAPWVIGADGAHSTVRKQLGIAFDGSRLPINFAITDAELTGDIAPDLVSYCYTAQGGLGLAPISPTRHRIAVSVPPQLADETPSRAFFQRIVEERGPGGVRLGELEFSTVFKVHVRTAQRFSSGRAFLAGDAAHLMSPAGGQGMNTGLLDASNLGWKLGGVLRGTLDPSVLDTYDTERRAAVHAVTRSTSLQTRWGALTKPSQLAVRDALVRAAGRTGLLQWQLAPKIGQLDATYRTGRPLGRPGAAAPGDRLPVLLGEGAAVAGPSWAAISGRDYAVLLHPGRARPADWQRTCAAIRAVVGAETEVVEAPSRVRGPLLTALGPRPAAALVRPDGHLHTLLPSPTPAAVAIALTAARHAVTG
ncbi:FAD-dependent monooxygenase [Streptantibioticus silvisoli]|uniref:FAD-dependent monooxygenase n=1 Tax=Streptantibioticus silvisoli TaxID=2705255 RepID=A0ABT6W0R8_9ACTN|nr:FAD-dependent monooxygenase [Streptantibioticus silvisoli]MDI5963303.1 FAD-dependent monooxygenase [Streptantibioticus silvisoli]